MAQSTQHKLDRVRPPRVQITYDVEIGDAIEMRELPFVMGVMADLSGERDPDREMPSVRDRKFVEIDRDNFDYIMTDIAPRLSFRVNNTMMAGAGGVQDDAAPQSGKAADAKPAGDSAGADSQLNVLLNFEKMEDFEPVNVLKQVEPLAKLYEARTKLHNLLAKLDGNDNLEKLLQGILDNTDNRTEVQKDIEDLRSSATKSKAEASGDKKTREKSK